MTAATQQRERTDTDIHTTLMSDVSRRDGTERHGEGMPRLIIEQRIMQDKCLFHSITKSGRNSLSLSTATAQTRNTNNITTNTWKNSAMLFTTI